MRGQKRDWERMKVRRDGEWGEGGWKRGAAVGAEEGGREEGKGKVVVG